MKYLIQGILFALCIFSIQKKSFSQEENKKPMIYTASYYADKYHGKKTANGEKFNNDEYTCASNHYKLGTFLQIVDTTNKKIVYVKVNDRMANFKKPRIDLSKKAFSTISNPKKGLTKVKVYIVDADIGQRKIMAQKEGDIEIMRENEL